jgi:hypothetical protein
MAVERCCWDKYMLQSNRQHTCGEIALPHNACNMSTICRHRWQSNLQQRNHLPAKASTKLNAVVARSDPSVAAVAVGPAAVAAFHLPLPLTALCLPLVLLPLVALPLPVPSAVAEVEPAVATPEAPPNVGVGSVAPAKGEKPKLAPEEDKVKPPFAGGSATCPGGLGSAAGAAWDASPLPAQQQLW